MPVHQHVGINPLLYQIFAVSGPIKIGKDDQESSLQLRTWEESQRYAFGTLREKRGIDFCLGLLAFLLTVPRRQCATAEMKYFSLACYRDCRVILVTSGYENVVGICLKWLYSAAIIRQ